MTYKLERKFVKYKNVLYQDYKINSSSISSKNIMLCNFGLSNGLEIEDLVEILKKYGTVTDICIIPNKSYCCISYETSSQAENFFVSCNGKHIFQKMNGPMYILYIEKLPQVDSMSNTFTNPKPEGLILLTDFVNDEEEKSLIDSLYSEEVDEVSTMKHRQVKHFGYEFLYKTNNIDKSNPLENKIPESCNFLFEKLKQKGYHEMIPWIPDQLTVNIYHPGQGIPPHVDTHSAFDDPILSLSLGSDVVMEFKNKQNDKTSLLLQRKSLLIMSGPSRYCWTHGIIPKKTDVILNKDNYFTTQKRNIRISLTFRHIRREECNCDYKDYCDSQEIKKNEKLTIDDDKLAKTIENVYVHDVYGNISQHFSETRHKPWPNVLNFVKSLPDGSILLDVGCGNGKYFGFNKNICEVGVDQCNDLLIIASERGFETATTNCLSLPFRNEMFDAVICIAVIHHLTTDERRINAIKEIIRVLKNNGKALIYVWAQNQRENNKASNYLRDEIAETIVKSDYMDVNVNNEKIILPVHTNRTQFKHSDILVPWKLKNINKSENAEKSNTTFLRFYHVFKQDELTNICNTLNNIKIIKSYYDEGNWCVLVEKVI